MLDELCADVGCTHRYTGSTVVLSTTLANAPRLLAALGQHGADINTVTRTEATGRGATGWALAIELDVTIRDEAQAIATAALMVDDEVRQGNAKWTSANRLADVDRTGTGRGTPYAEILNRAFELLRDAPFGEQLPSSPQVDMLATLILDAVPYDAAKTCDLIARTTMAWQVVKNLDWLDVARTIGRDVRVKTVTASDPAVRSL